MGAMAISTLSGSILIENAADAAFLETLLPFLKGFTIFFWATGTWWIPILVILFVWRHLYRKFPLSYDPLYWGAVFPLGMYAACTFGMARAMNLDFLLPLARVFVYVALLAWTATFFGLIHSLVSCLIPTLRAAHRRRHGGRAAAVRARSRGLVRAVGRLVGRASAPHRARHAPAPWPGTALASL